MQPTYRVEQGLTKGSVALMAAIILLLIGLAENDCSAAKLKQKTFASPEAAFSDMAIALKNGNDKELIAIFGPSAKEYLSAEEGVKRDKITRFLKAYEEKRRIEIIGEHKSVLHVGMNDWSWPIPVVKSGQRWRFDTKAGKSEMLARRIGRNEVAAVQVCLAYVDAQREYAEEHPTGKGGEEYAQKFTSDDGKKNGLCWETKQGEKQSPLGPELAGACMESGSASISGGEPTTSKPYHGYFYKILTKQGPNAAGGAYDYVINGRMVGGFALVAYPAEYGTTGIMTFIVNQDGIVFQKNLGRETTQKAEAMTLFDPDRIWEKVD